MAREEMHARPHGARRMTKMDGPTHAARSMVRRRRARTALMAGPLGVLLADDERKRQRGVQHALEGAREAVEDAGVLEGHEADVVLARAQVVPRVALPRRARAGALHVLRQDAARAAVLHGQGGARQGGGCGGRACAPVSE